MRDVLVSGVSSERLNACVFMSIMVTLLFLGICFFLIRILSTPRFEFVLYDLRASAESL